MADNPETAVLDRLIAEAGDMADYMEKPTRLDARFGRTHLPLGK